MRILKLHEDVQAALRGGRISEGHAKILAGIPEHSEQLRLLEKITSENLSVRQLEGLISNSKPKKKTKVTVAVAQLPEVKKFEEDLKDAEKIDKNKWLKRPWHVQLPEKIFKLFSSVL